MPSKPDLGFLHNKSFSYELCHIHNIWQNNHVRQTDSRSWESRGVRVPQRRLHKMCVQTHVYMHACTETVTSTQTPTHSPGSGCRLRLYWGMSN
uniref:Uncharacterized protein n=1 Tax=Electrophorus electricus TaxID=8005 RepID=A0AAY5EXL3_ELEEL